MHKMPAKGKSQKKDNSPTFIGLLSVNVISTQRWQDKYWLAKYLSNIY